jgi:1-acyl-sn-glycerol-3-phosphate acyltransferase
MSGERHPPPTLSRLGHAFLVFLVAPVSTLYISLAALVFVHVLRRPSDSCQRLARGWGRLILRVGGVRVTKEGGDDLDPSAPYIFACNHQSQFDIPVLHGFLGHDFRWLAKKELFQVPIWGAAMRASGYISIDRSQGREALRSLSEAAAEVAAGKSVVIFPEGTRSPDGRLGDFKAGGMQLAIKAGVPIVPVAIRGTHRILPKGKLLVTPGEVTVRVGAPVEVKDCRPREKHDLALQVRARVADMLGEEGATAAAEGKEAFSS